MAKPGPGFDYPGSPQPAYAPNFPTGYGEGYPQPNQNYPYPQPNYPPIPPGSQGSPMSQGYVGIPGAPGYPPSLPPEYTPYPPGGYVPAGYVSPQAPIVQQPGMQGPGVQGPGMQGAAGWMNIPQAPTNCPPGLEYLSMIDQLLVHQKVELLEALVGFETKNKYTVKNSIGQKVYYAAEDSDCLTRNCCGPWRPFEMKILDNYRNQVIHMYRPLACDSCCFPCCLQSMEISSPPGTVIGRIEQEWSICYPSFSVKNASGETVLRISGPMCRFTMCGDVEFKILSVDGETVVGKISKQWSGLLREMFTDADYFGITFPMDLDVRMKAVLLGALFLIDAMFFEKSNNRESDGLGMI